MSSGKGRRQQPIIVTLVSLILATAVAVGLQAHERSNGRADLYGYTMAESRASEACRYDYIELDGAGEALALAPGHGKAAADDAAALLALAEPFELYQTPVKSLVVSGNGYLAAAESLEIEDGSDFSNDCGLPVRADNAAASQNRIYVYHDDLRPQDGGQVRQAHFRECPRASDTGATEACTVVEWSRFERAGPLASSQPLRAQAVLYHGSHEIALQYAAVDDSRAAQATIGLQGFNGRTARQAGCNAQNRVRPKQTICFFDPRHNQASIPAGTVLR